MASKTTNFTLILFVILLSATTIMSFDITKLLQQHSDVSTFNEFLTQTGLATNINNRQTLTVFAIDNSGMGSITSKPREVIKNILAIHVALDYYDPKKLDDFANKSGTLTTLFQATGAAMGQQGFLKVSKSGNDVVVGSAVEKAPQSAKVLKSLVSEPYNISVLQISQPIMTPGIDQIAPPGAPKAEAPKEAPTPKKGHEGKAPESDESGSEGKDSSSSSHSSSPKGDASDEESADKKSSPPHKAAATQMTNVGGLVFPAALMMGLLVALAL